MTRPGSAGASPERQSSRSDRGTITSVHESSPPHEAAATSPTITAALEQVAPRLKALRAARGVTLGRLSEATGISRSTLSRLENGQRRPTLELLLSLAVVYRVPLDDLVGAPELGDPRIRLRPQRVKGRTVVPLTRQPGGMQAWKIVIPVSQVDPEPRSHEGYEWLYVLSGRMRLVLGERDLVLGPGELAEFDTTTRHWFGSTGEGPAEVLSLFGRHGERMHLQSVTAHVVDVTREAGEQGSEPEPPAGPAT